jgi:large repetitive protein
VLRSVIGRAASTARILPVVGLMAALTGAAPALADVAPVSSAGPLAISQSATGTETIGQVETFTITVTNTTAGVANNVFLGDTLPAGARLTGALPNPNLCARTGSGGLQAFACLVGPLAAGASFNITFQIIPSTSSITNHAATTGFAGGSFVSNTVDLVIALTGGGSTTVPSSSSADVQITGFATTGQPTAGSSFGYVYQVKNNGPQVASAVTFTDTLPAGEGYVGAGNSVTGLCSNNAGTVSCSLGDLAVGASALVGIQVTAPTGLVSGTQITNVGNAASATADSNANNNSFAVTVKVQ